MGNIRAICISKQRGTAKTEVVEAELTPQWGILGRCSRRPVASSGEHALCRENSGFSGKRSRSGLRRFWRKSGGRGI